MRNPVHLALALALALALPAFGGPAYGAERARGNRAGATSQRGRPRRAHRGDMVRASRTGGPFTRQHGGAAAPRERPASVGSPNDGHLQGGIRLNTPKPYLRVVPAYESGDVRWGMPQLVNMIDRAARVVATQFPGAVLDVGDLSKRGGGDLLRHHSHESGRDADIGFYAVDARGKQVHGGVFVKFDASGSSPTNPGAQFDVPRNWTFIRELLTDPTAHVSHVFIAEYLRQRLLAYARPRVSHVVYERAALTLMQPHDSLPHDDHIHVRISCPHEVNSTCLELAKAGPHSSGLRMAHHRAPAAVLRTPHPHLTQKKPPVAYLPAPKTPFELPAVQEPNDPEMDGDD